MRMKLFISIVLTIAFSSAKAQYYFYDGRYYEKDVLFEAGLSVGAMNAFTDVGGRKGIGKKFVKDFNFKNTKISGGVFAGIMYKNAIGFRLDATFGSITAYDSILKKVGPSTNGRYERNLEFKSSITEIVGLFEFHPFEMFSSYDEENYPPAVSPYIVAGIGYFHFNPQATLNGQLVDLQPLSLEGQGFSEYPNVKEYKLDQINFPIGMGARYDLNHAFNLRVEMLYRILSTDYLDDVSGKYIEPSVFANYLSGYKLNQALLLNDRHIPGAEYSTAHPNGVRGNPKNNDGYITFCVKIGFTLGRDRQ